MARTGEDIAAAPLDLATERIRRVYRGWNRDMSVAPMRIDWDAAFESDMDVPKVTIKIGS
jgi:epsilon-lactone hydrolase